MRARLWNDLPLMIIGLCFVHRCDTQSAAESEYFKHIIVCLYIWTMKLSFFLVLLLPICGPFDKVGHYCLSSSRAMTQGLDFVLKNAFKTAEFLITTCWLGMLRVLYCLVMRWVRKSGRLREKVERIHKKVWSQVWQDRNLIFCGRNLEK